MIAVESRRWHLHTATNSAQYVPKKLDWELELVFYYLHTITYYCKIFFNSDEGPYGMWVFPQLTPNSKRSCYM